MMAEKLGEAVLELTVDGKQYKYSLNQIEKETKKTFKTLDGVVLGLGNALVQLGKESFQQLIDFTNESIQVAMDAQETYSKYDTVFEDVGAAADAMAEKFADDFDLASSTAKTLLADTGDLLTGFGIAASEALNLSEATNSLAQDLVSFSNAAGGAEAVSSALISAYSGNRLALKSYGIVLTDAMVDAEMLRQAQQGLTYETEQQAKIYATLKLAQEQSKNAIGDYATTADSAANVQRRLEESTKDLQEALGNVFISTLTNARLAVIKFQEAVTDMIEAHNEWKNALKAAEDGEATLNDQLVLQNKLLLETENSMRKWGTPEKEIEKATVAIKAEIASIEEQIAAEQQAAEETRKAEEKKRIEREETAKAEQEQVDSLAAYLKEVSEAYSETEEGKIEALQKEISKWEEYEQTAVSTLPQVQAVLKMLREEMKSLTSATDPSESLELWAEWYNKLLDTQQDYIEKSKAAELKAAAERGASLEEQLSIVEQYQEKQLDFFVNRIEAEKAAALEEADTYKLTEEQKLEIAKYYDDQITAYQDEQADERIAIEERVVAEMEQAWQDALTFWNNTLTAMGNALAGLAGDSETAFAQLAATAGSIIELIASEGTSISGWASLVENLGSLAESAGIESYEELQATLEALSETLLTALAPVLDFLMSQLNMLMTYLGPIVELIGSVLSVLMPIVEVLIALTNVLTGMPVLLELVSAIASALSAVFTALYNKVIVPVYNKITVVYNKILEGFTTFVNKVIAIINKMISWTGQQLSYVSASSMSMGTISTISTDSTGTTDSSSSTTSSSASYTQVRPINNYFYIEDNNFNGAGGLREFVIMLDAEWKEANSLGLVG